MAREKEGYRNQLEALILHFGADVGMVTQKQEDIKDTNHERTATETKQI